MITSRGVSSDLVEALQPGHLISLSFSDGARGASPPAVGLSTPWVVGRGTKACFFILCWEWRGVSTSRRRVFSTSYPRFFSAIRCMIASTAFHRHIPISTSSLCLDIAFCEIAPHSLTYVTRSEDLHETVKLNERRSRAIPHYRYRTFSALGRFSLRKPTPI
jgi:hypothetical protein